MDRNAEPTAFSVNSMELLDCFRQNPDGLTLVEISKLAKIPRSSAHRLLLRMMLGGLIEPTDEGRYVIANSLFQSGVLAPKLQELGSLAHSVLNDLARETGETANLGALDGPNIIFIDVIESIHHLRVAVKPGSSKPFHLIALGKSAAAFMPQDKLDVLWRNLPLPLEAPTPNSISDLAQLREEFRQIRRHGYAVSDEEYILGVRAVAAPIFSRKGGVEGALGVSGPANRLSIEKIATLAELVITAAENVTEQLGGPQNSIRSLLGSNAELASHVGEPLT
jgi:DNA-binding IclR family transcriptional regulator